MHDLNSWPLKGPPAMKQAQNTTLGSSGSPLQKPWVPPADHSSCTSPARSVSYQDEAPGGAEASGREEAQSSTCRKGLNLKATAVSSFLLVRSSKTRTCHVSKGWRPCCCGAAAASVPPS